MNALRPHPFQTSDSQFRVEGSGPFNVAETWYAIDRWRQDVDFEACHGPFATKADALAWIARRLPAPVLLAAE